MGNRALEENRIDACAHFAKTLACSKAQQERKKLATCEADLRKAREAVEECGDR